MAENEMKWKKQPSGWQWHKVTETYRAEIARVTGGYTGKPYEWRVHPLPRPQGERWVAIGRGWCAKLAEAKAQADEAITRIGD